MFADDAYNKYTSGGHGSLIGNWLEERAIRDATGEGRTVPQRHIPRSGLLKDFTKKPSAGPRKQDNTFERVYGPEANARHVPFSKTIGAGEADLAGEGFPVPLMLQAEGRVARQGPRETAAAAARQEVAEQDQQEEEDERDRQANVRHFATTTGSHFDKPNETQVEKPTRLRQSFMDELRHGPTPDRSKGMQNRGLEVRPDVHYSNLQGVTHAHMSLVDGALRNDMKVSCGGGFSAFGKQSDFSKPINEFVRGLSKDDEMDELYKTVKGADPLGQPAGVAPRAAAFAGVPSLAALKAAVHARIAEVLGPHGYISLRQRLYDTGDQEGFVPMSDIVGVLRNELGLTQEDVGDQELGIYLNQLVTMRKNEVRIAAFITSLRPPLPQAVKRAVLQTFAGLLGGEGGAAIRLGVWLSRVTDGELRQTLVSAFGGEDEASVADTPVTESVFVELFSDLAPLVDIRPLLA